MRLAEIVGTLSLAADAGTGMPEEHGLRAAVLAVRLAGVTGADERTGADAYYIALLALAGCTAEGPQMAALFGDEVEFGRETVGMDYGRPAELLPAILRRARRGKGVVGSAIAMTRAVAKLPAMRHTGRAHCEVACHLAGRLGFDQRLRNALFQAFERWDGSGMPSNVKGEAIAQSTRIAQVAIAAEIAHGRGGVEAARAVVAQRKKRALDPKLCEAFVRSARDICGALEAASAWDAAMNAEPAPRREVEGDAVGDALTALADFADLKSRFTRGHSSGVAARAAAAARALGLGGDLERAVEHAGLLHDVGRVAVTAAIWDKPAALTDAERERIRLHSYVGERVLARARSLAPAAEIASLTHERLDGTGYHRRLPAAACSAAARVLAVADVYQALTEDRPHRPAKNPDEAAAELTKMASTGALWPEASSAILAAAGHQQLGRTSRRRERASGLTDREVEVLRLVARGLTNKEIARALDIATKTAGHHLENVFHKLGVTTRAGATMLALQQGLAP